MRTIVACPACRRQYNAAGHAPGARLHCSCGETLVVPSRRGHDAAVVRCSACGSPRSDDDRACAHCGAVLTLHERDLHTMCPGCLSRISDRALFCHHCGLAIVPEPVQDEATAAICPACGAPAVLHSRRFERENLAISECQRCGGLWVGAAVFRQLEARARATPREPPAPLDADATGKAQPTPRPAQKGSLYRPCPQCSKLMNRTNYGRRSGVVVDRCRAHGVWFDADELAQVLRWIRHGGPAKAKARLREQARQEETLARLDIGPQPTQPLFKPEPRWPELTDILWSLSTWLRHRP